MVSSTDSNILLDSNIRDWVVLPLFVIMVAAGLLRFYMGNWLKPAPKAMSKVFQRTQTTLRSTSILKTGATHFLSTSKLEARKAAYPEVLKEQAEWCETHLDEQEEAAKAGADGEDGGAMPSPFAAMEGMGGNMVFMVQNMVMMQAIQHFFSGFILLKVPFHLTMGFKQMFQRGLEGLATLDTSYVSSVSWYFLVMFGLRGFFRLVIGTPKMETIQTQQLLSAFGNKPGGGGPGGNVDDDAMIKKLTEEADNLFIVLPKQFKSHLDSVEKRLLKQNYPKKKATISSSDFLLHKSSKKNK
jgi:hypothetical protein